MLVFNDKASLQAQLDEWRLADEPVALVATMGNLHPGHVSLVDVARKHAERVVVSIFVNPTQFGEDEDFDDYPRTLERDTRRLRKTGADILFAPAVDEIYPFGLAHATLVTVPFLTDKFCGSHRPGHFDGVTSVVARLFALVQPEIAVFGQKDFQQQLVIRRMVDDLGLPIGIITAPTVREEDGLAMSSRNAYLTATQRTRAPLLYQVLCRIGDALEEGETDYAGLEAQAMEDLETAGFHPEYVAIRRAGDLGAPGRDNAELVVLAAAQLGAARLIDNVVISVRGAAR